MLTYSRVPARHIEELMQEPELVIELVQDMGFSLEDNLNSDEMLGLLESRWQGNEQNYSLEEFSDITQHVLLDVCPAKALNLLFKEGKKSKVSINNQAIFVLSPHEVHAVALALYNIDLASLQQEWMRIDKFLSIRPTIEAKDIDLFWMLFPGIVSFFNHASANEECVLRSTPT